MKNSQNQIFNRCLIGLGAIMFVCTLFTSSALIVFQILGVVFLMAGAYRSSLFQSEALENKRDNEEKEV
jgi:hypothetical protein